MSHVSALQAPWLTSLAGLALRWRFVGTVRASRCCPWWTNWPSGGSQIGTAWCVVFSATAWRGASVAWTATKSTSWSWRNPSLEQDAPLWLENPNCFSSRPARAKNTSVVSTWTVTSLKTVVWTPMLSKWESAFRLTPISCWEYPQFLILSLLETGNRDHGIFSHCAKTWWRWCRGSWHISASSITKVTSMMLPVIWKWGRISLFDFSCRDIDLVSILTKVNADVSKKSDYTGSKKQMPQPAFTLTKRVVFPVPSGAIPALPSFTTCWEKGQPVTQKLMLSGYLILWAIHLNVFQWSFLLFAVLMTISLIVKCHR